MEPILDIMANFRSGTDLASVTLLLTILACGGSATAQDLGTDSCPAGRCGLGAGLGATVGFAGGTFAGAALFRMAGALRCANSGEGGEGFRVCSVGFFPAAVAFASVPLGTAFGAHLGSGRRGEFAQTLLGAWLGMALGMFVLNGFTENAQLQGRAPLAVIPLFTIPIAAGVEVDGARRPDPR